MAFSLSANVHEKQVETQWTGMREKQKADYLEFKTQYHASAVEHPDPFNSQNKYTLLTSEPIVSK